MPPETKNHMQRQRSPQKRSRQAWQNVDTIYPQDIKLSDRFNLPGMIPFTYPRLGKDKFKAVGLQELPSLTFPSNNLSTSPHSLDSLENKVSRHAYLTQKNEITTHSLSPRLTEIKICIYDRTYLLDGLEGERCVTRLEEILKEWEINQKTKISIKLIVIKTIVEINAKYSEMFNETVRQYETYLKGCI